LHLYLQANTCIIEGWPNILQAIGHATGRAIIKNGCKTSSQNNWRCQWVNEHTQKPIEYLSQLN
jgi:hypothetical protein